MTPILYTYRRCPYAMRARMALQYAGIQFEYREIELRNKPQSMLDLSPKGTVPVLYVDGLVLDQSLDIMCWALKVSDPDGWNMLDENIAKTWIEKNDEVFKGLLDQYKYPNRYPQLNQVAVLADVMELMLEPMERALGSSEYLLGGRMTWVDVAIFPFIRQFSMVDQQKFELLPIPHIQKWLRRQIESKLFLSVMDKHPAWRD
ncbi:glutathione S-transferase [Polynucleobacter campilacus]|uniref:Glutathione S-transferase n=2 Tax=Burkholderiaceae TaxID=119060 RepID=A0A254PXJ1_9BURK|nr:glutathione S-transferase [Polynucleobacter sp. UB-Piko-W3]OWS71245.1 glutathione S-transferase [Polynucleobacter campilacus]